MSGTNSDVRMCVITI